MPSESNKQLTKTAKHSMIYGVGMMISSLTGLLMLPIYTRYLTPADYGVISLLTIMTDVAAVLIGMRIAQSMFRFYMMSEEEQEKRSVVSTILILTVIAGSFGVLMMYLFAEGLSQVLFGSTEFTIDVRIFAFTLLANGVVAVGKTYLRALQRPYLFVGVSIASLIISVIFNLIFVVYLDMHVRGVVIASLCAAVPIVLYLLVLLIGRNGLNFSRDMAVRVYKFTIPLIIGSVAGAYIAYAPNYFTRIFDSLATVGILAVAIRVSGFMSVIARAVNASWSADRYVVYKQEDANRTFDSMFRLFGGLMLVIAALVSIFAVDLMYFMTTPEFYAAADVVPILAAGMIFGFLKVYCNFGLHLEAKTRHIAEASYISAAVTTLACVFLIPEFQLYGAAAAIAIGKLVEFYWVNRTSMACYDMQLSWGRFIMMSAMTLAAVVIASLVPVGELMHTGLRIIIFCALLATLYILPIWSQDERALMRKFTDRIGITSRLGRPA